MGGEIKLAIEAMELAGTVLPIVAPMAVVGAQALHKKLVDLHASGTTHLVPGQFTDLAKEAEADMDAIFDGLALAKTIIKNHVFAQTK